MNDTKEAISVFEVYKFFDREHPTGKLRWRGCDSPLLAELLEIAQSCNYSYHIETQTRRFFYNTIESDHHTRVMVFTPNDKSGDGQS